MTKKKFSWFLLKIGVEMHEVCHNARGKNCWRCRDECILSGTNFISDNVRKQEK